LKVVIFGATSAIAQETAKHFAADGADMAVVGRDSARLNTIRDDLLARGAAKAVPFVADLAELGGHEQLIAGIAEHLGGIDAALIAHGTLGDQQRSQSDAADMLREMNTNALSYMSLMTHLANRMERQHYGCLAVITSVAGDRGRPRNYVYGAAKAAVSAFASGMRARLSRSGVALVTIKPGPVDTPMTATHRKSPLFATPEKVGLRIYEAMLKGEDVVYTPWFWSPIMLVIRALPERVFKRLNL
jgi:short-subunit dehydrogenase